MLKKITLKKEKISLIVWSEILKILLMILISFNCLSIGDINKILVMQSVSVAYSHLEKL